MENNTKKIKVTMMETSKWLGATVSYEGDITSGEVFRGIHTIMTDIMQKTSLTFEQLLEALADIELHRGKVDTMSYTGNLTDDEIKAKMLGMAKKVEEGK